MIDTAVKTTLVRLLGPLVRYLIERGWGYVALRELLKAIYVAEAEKRQLATTGTVPTDSEISLLTGIHRKEVKRLREELRSRSGETGSDPMAGANISARVIAAWITDRRFLTGDKPSVLSLRAEGDTPSFDMLVQSTRADMRPKAIFEELLRVGAVERAGEDSVRLVRTAYVALEPKEKLAFLAANVGDHLRSALHNLSRPDAPFLERALYHDTISSEQLAAARDEMMSLADQLLRKANEQLIGANTIGTETGAEPRKRMRLGVYYYEADSDDEA